MNVDDGIVRNREAFAMAWMTKFWYMFPTMPAYWCYRTFKRLLPNAVVRDYAHLSSEADASGATPAQYKDDCRHLHHDYVIQVVYWGLLEHLYGQACFWKIMEKKDKLFGAGAHYIWQDVSSDDLRSGC